MAADSDCVFCRIVAGEIPAAIVLRNEACVAFLDIAPQAEGHLLLIPAEHYPRLEEVPADVLAELGRAMPRLARALLEVTGAAGFNVLQNNGQVAGQDILHVHFHLIPRTKGDGLGYRWQPKSYPAGRADELRARFQSALAE